MPSLSEVASIGGAIWAERLKKYGTRQIILLNVSYLLNNQVKLQSHLNQIEDKIDKRVNNS